jgi:hypothetical protein
MIGNATPRIIAVNARVVFNCSLFLWNAQSLQSLSAE